MACNLCESNIVMLVSGCLQWAVAAVRTECQKTEQRQNQRLAYNKRFLFAFTSLRTAY